MKISPICNQSFRAIHEYSFEENYNPETPRLVHTSFFFRYNDIDEFIVEKLEQKQRFRNDPLNILSAGCSFGEEVYSYALALNHLQKQPNILGIDLSLESIAGAQIGEFELDINEREMLQEEFSLPRIEDQTPRKKELKRRFNEAFQCTNKRRGIFLKKENSFKNCAFKQANILKLDELVEANSQDAILCRFVLYHLKKEDIEKFAQQAYKALKPGGLLCIEPSGYPKYQFELINAGFTQPYKGAPCIFKKPKIDIAKILFNQKFNLNNI